MEYNEQAILKALIYSSIFQYPLTDSELWQYAISEKPLDKKIFFLKLSKSSLIKKNKQLYFLSNEEHTVSLRLSREKIAAKKLVIAQKMSSILSKISMIQFIGISGSLSMANTREEDDIDLFIITQKKSVWITRVFILLILELVGKRRRKYAIHVNNKICINLLIEESHVAFPKSMQNLYTAHEIAQVKPLFNRNQTYEKFLLVNAWVKSFLPNTGFSISPPAERGRTKESACLTGERPVGRGGLVFLNFLAKRMQLWYMKRHRTSEIITDTVLAFYTNDMEKKVLQMYTEKMKQYEI